MKNQPNFNTMFEEIDKLLNDLKEKQELDDFINNGIYPKRLLPRKIKYIPPIKETILPEIVLVDISSYCLDIKKKLEIVNDFIISSNNTPVFDNIETCPICIHELNNTNIIIPQCGHKTCIQCFVSNLQKNRCTGNLCSLCRMNII